MSLNPIHYTENVINGYLKYQLTAYALADEHLHKQMRTLLSLEETRRSPLMQGPYVSLSRSFASGAAVRDLVADGTFHPHMERLVPYSHVYAHQEKAIRSIAAWKTTLVSTGTGSGKTEAFLYPIISRCLQLRDDNAHAGIVAVIVYPMNALAEDQLGRLRELLAGTGISFGMYVGSTPEKDADAGVPLAEGTSQAEYALRVRQARNQYTVHPAEERCSREAMRRRGNQPRILLTNVKQLELLLTRYTDVELFDNSMLDYLVFDEAHTYTGARGAETACLIRRLRAFCRREADATVCIATSATIADPTGAGGAAQSFAARFFGVNASGVELVNERYQRDDWGTNRSLPPVFPMDAPALLQEALVALEPEQEAPAQVSDICLRIMGSAINIKPDQWQESLYDLLASNECVYQISRCLSSPKPFQEVHHDLQRLTGRVVTDEELLVWLSLGASARKEGRPLLRPVVHGFVRGIPGAVVTFPSNEERPHLYLSTQEEIAARVESSLFPLKLFTCTTCGQHYFEHHLQDFEFASKNPGGGCPAEGHVFWEPLSAASGGRRVVLVDHVIADDEEDGIEGRGARLYFCRHCGTMHSVRANACSHCGRTIEPVELWAMKQNEDRPGKLRSCVTCGAAGGATGIRYREPIRQVRATAVADVHVLAQEMIRNAERKRLLVFADNRQDAAFQAGWMRDHARRFRLRSLMWEYLKKGACKIGDLVGDVERVLDMDDDLSKALIPEVWEAYRKNAAPGKHADERRYYIRIQVLREFTTGLRQRYGLEPWGKARVEYDGISAADPFIVNEADKLDISVNSLLDGVATLLDLTRRRQMVFDPEGRIFSRFWMDGDREIQRGYLAATRGIPRGLKLTRDEEDHTGRVLQWLTPRGNTPAAQAVRSWGVPPDDTERFLTDLWTYLIDANVLTHVTLTGAKGRALPNCRGTYQVHGDCLYLVPQDAGWQCATCRRLYSRTPPNDACPAWRCGGRLNKVAVNGEDYDLMSLDYEGEMVRAAEHSAQVPHRERENLEREFKAGERGVNTLVCTPTLEMGVDIGGLDSVLMRNVPPLPANYWQRAGRAGRRHRVAVNLTYARPVTHDQFFYGDPLRMLNGAIEPPRFNLRNDLMIRKHVHAATMTRLHELARPMNLGTLPYAEREAITETLRHAFPRTVKDYLFDDSGTVMDVPRDVSKLTTIISQHEDNLLAYVEEVFSQGWPAADREMVDRDTLRTILRETGFELAAVIVTLKRRLGWALDQMARLDDTRRRQGTRSPEEDSHFDRCDRLVKRLKGMDPRRRKDSEGYDDSLTYSVLAVEGYLPGYGLESGAVIGTANVPRHLALGDFDLPRAPAIALREYVPGNMIYANGHKFVARYFHLDAAGDGGQPLPFFVDPASESIMPAGASGGSTSPLAGADLEAVPICDVDLTHSAHISDEEEYRFQLSVAVYGREMDRHGGGNAYTWGARDVYARRNVHFRLVNVGADFMVRQGQFGYPVCLVCGQSTSPMGSEKQLEDFSKDHRARCGREVKSVGFYTDVFADALTIPGCANREEAYSILESLRVGATRVLDMERDDLMVLVTGDPASDRVDATLIDPMSGGSGLISQLCERFGDVAVAAMDVAANCRWNCSDVCDGCLATFRNSYYHRHLKRQIAVQEISVAGSDLKFAHDIPPRLPIADQGADSMPVNAAEALFKSMMQRAGFPDPQWHHQIDMGRPLGTTSPDAFYDDENLCIYLDGLSAHIHGNPRTIVQDRRIREQLRAQDYEVFEIAVSHLHDRAKMAQHFYRIARALLGKSQATTIRDNDVWFDDSTQ